MAERLIASVLKTEVGKLTVGSNPTRPANNQTSWHLKSS